MDINELITKDDLVRFEKRIIEKMEYIITKTGPLEKKWLRSKDVQEMLGISSSSLQNLRINGIVQYSKIQGTIFYKLNDVLDVLEKNKIGNGLSA